MNIYTSQGVFITQITQDHDALFKLLFHPCCKATAFLR